MKKHSQLIWKFFLFFFQISAIAILSTIYIANGPPGYRWLWLTLLAFVLAAICTFTIWKISKSLDKTREGMSILSEGNLRLRLDVPKQETFGDLSLELNNMAAELEKHIATIGHERNEQQVILSSMIEGVIALDEKLSIHRINTAAAELIGLPSDRLFKRPLREAIRNRELQQLVERTREENRPLVEEVVMIIGKSARFLQARCVPLNTNHANRLGALLVLNDITHLRKLEGMRSEFVANVSHELKTPLTSIKGFAETLLDGALEDPNEARNFCRIIVKQVDRLQAIIEDLLSLSRIEQEEADAGMTLSACRLNAILQNAAQMVSHQASAKNISIEIACDDELTVMADPQLFEQVAVNLLDNAIKYSESDTGISVRVERENDEWKISFVDQGAGIESKHLNRIFERFYRIDKARSRKAGGTGLGLAIVKHIVSAHHGRITVTSEVGKGSVFSVFLPTS